MGLRATQYRERWARPGGSSRRAPAAFPRVVGVVAMVLFASQLMAAPAVAQVTAKGQATVRVGQVSLLDVQHHASAAVGTPGAAGRDAGLRTETYRVRVRANHRWKVVLASESGAATAVWVRTVDGRGASTEQYVEPGASIEVASGDRGDRVVEVEVRWEASAYPGAATLPIRYSLAPSDD